MGTNSRGEPCGNRAVEGTDYCKFHQNGDAPTDADELKRQLAEASEETKSVIELAEEAVAQIEVFGAELVESVNEAVDSVKEAIAEMQASQATLKTNVDFLLATYEMDDEARKLLEAMAQRNNISVGEQLSLIVTNILTWHPDSFAVMLEPEIAVRVKELSEGRMLSPQQVVHSALIESEQSGML
jgi:hypothetical protein